ncbi:sigma-54-dependent transcriptional regulator [Microvirga puerhi]|uniref:Sigma 54-interacting transcriptional regulator n=1 Tax=Microvirga puerhi TaxID=2876078 RepID=A0ABS7VQG3_9HYPH|nr:sigma 54-interacting transcriptional regulator [Microvirga puerhi]MBZ6077350.1 sigma 54-interacting transcriptional regulator [Microvirga puerhi]
MLLPQIFADDIRALRQGAAGHVAHPEGLRTIRLADRAARSMLPVLIEGEPGSGATALARAIHASGDRKGRPFIILRGSERPEREEDQEILLQNGLREAHGGTLCIEDIQHLSTAAQSRLLDGLTQQDGPRRSSRLDVRIIATSGLSLNEEVRRGRFRENLYYRLQVQPIVLRPLRTEPELVDEWARIFLRLLAKEEGKALIDLAPDALDLLARYDWPGNLRQLENAIFRAVVLAEGSVLTAAEFPQVAARAGKSRIDIPALPETQLLPVYDRLLPQSRDPSTLALMSACGEMRTLAELEAEVIRFALSHYRGQMSAISRRLGIGRSTLYRKLKELGLSDEAA